MTENPADYDPDRDPDTDATSLAPEPGLPQRRSVPDSAVDDAERQSDPADRQDAELTDE